MYFFLFELELLFSSLAKQLEFFKSTETGFEILKFLFKCKLFEFILENLFEFILEKLFKFDRSEPTVKQFLRISDSFPNLNFEQNYCQSMLKQ